MHDVHKNSSKNIFSTNIIKKSWFRSIGNLVKILKIKYLDQRLKFDVGVKLHKVASSKSCATQFEPKYERIRARFRTQIYRFIGFAVQDDGEIQDFLENHKN